MENQELMPFMLKYGLLASENSVNIERLLNFLPSSFREYIRERGKNEILIEDLELLLSNPPMESLSQIEEEIKEINENITQFTGKLELVSEQQAKVETQLQMILTDETDYVEPLDMEKLIIDRVSSHIVQNCIALEKGIEQTQQTQTFNEQMEQLLLLKQSVIALNQTLQKDASESDAVTTGGFEHIELIHHEECSLLDTHSTLARHIVHGDAWVLGFCVLLTIFAFVLS